MILSCVFFLNIDLSCELIMFGMDLRDTTLFGQILDNNTLKLNNQNIKDIHANTPPFFYYSKIESSGYKKQLACFFMKLNLEEEEEEEENKKLDSIEWEGFL